MMILYGMPPSEFKHEKAELKSLIRKKLTISSCMECPYYRYDNRYTGDNPMFRTCSLLGIMITTISEIPDWCQLKNEE